MLILNLHRSIWHKQRIRYSHIDSFDLVARSSGVSLIITARSSDVECWLFVWWYSMILVQNSVLLTRIATRILIYVVEVNISRIYDSLLKVACANLIRAACLRSILVCLTFNVFKIWLPVPLKLVFLWIMRWLGIWLVVIIVSTRPCFTSSWWSSSLWVTRLHIYVLLTLVNL